MPPELAALDGQTVTVTGVDRETGETVTVTGVDRETGEIVRGAGRECRFCLIATATVLKLPPIGSSHA